MVLNTIDLLNMQPSAAVTFCFVVLVVGGTFATIADDGVTVMPLALPRPVKLSKPEM